MIQFYLTNRFEIEITWRNFVIFDHKNIKYFFEIGLSDYSPGNFVLGFNEKYLINRN